MADVNPLHKLIVLAVLAALICIPVVIVSLEKPSCPSGASQESVSVSICKAVQGE